MSAGKCPQNAFDQRKANILKDLLSGVSDKSPKGSIDAPIVDMCCMINEHPDIYTTSSCSGRIVLYKDGALSKSGEWLVADHSEVTEHQVFDALAAALPEEEAQLLHGFTSMTSESSLNKTSTYIPIKSHSPNAINMEASTCNVHFRFEAFVLAVETRTLECASTFLTVAHQCGYRESGISAVAKRFIVNVRGSLRLDVPVVLDSRLLVSPQYIQLLVALANEKMRKNLDKISRFDTLLQATLAAQQASSAPLSLLPDADADADADDRADALSAVRDPAPSSPLLWSTLCSSASPHGLAAGLALLVPRPQTTATKDALKAKQWFPKRAPVAMASAAAVQEALRQTYHVEVPLAASAENSAPKDGSADAFPSGSGVPVPWALSADAYSLIPVADHATEALLALATRLYAGTGLQKLRTDAHAPLLRSSLLAAELQIAEPPLLLPVALTPTLTLLAAQHPIPKPAPKPVVDADVPAAETDPSSNKPLDLCSASSPVVVLVPRASAKRLKDALQAAQVLPKRAPAVSVTALDAEALLKSIERSAKTQRDWSGALIGFNIEVEAITRSIVPAAELASGSTWVPVPQSGASADDALMILVVASNVFARATAAAQTTVAQAPRLPPLPSAPQEVLALALAVLLLLRSSAPGAALEAILTPARELAREMLPLVPCKWELLGGCALLQCGAFDNALFQHITAHNDEELADAGALSPSAPALMSPRFRGRLSLREVGLLCCAVLGAHTAAVQQPIQTNLMRSSQVRVIARVAHGSPAHAAAATAMPPVTERASAMAVRPLLQLLVDAHANHDAIAKGIQAALAPASPRAQELSADTPVSASDSGSPTTVSALSPLQVAALRPSSLKTLLPQLCVAGYASAPSAAAPADPAPDAASTGVDDADACWALHRENGLAYVLDTTRSMFSSGNTTEKARAAMYSRIYPCTAAADGGDEHVVDLYSGIGYFTLPMVTKGGAAHVFACELNPASNTAIWHAALVNHARARALLEHNEVIKKKSKSDKSHTLESISSPVPSPAPKGVLERLTLLPGDNRRPAVALVTRNTAHRVSLGLLPSATDGLATALIALRPRGGVLHVHANVPKGAEAEWARDTLVPALCDRVGVLRDAVGAYGSLRELAEAGGADASGLVDGKDHNGDYIFDVEGARKAISECSVQDSCSSFDESVTRELLQAISTPCSGNSQQSPVAAGPVWDSTKNAWDFTVLHVESVKSYSPKVVHVVIDIGVAVKGSGKWGTESAL